MMFADTTPRLKAERTVSDPTSPASTLGFEGRNTLLGLESLIITDEGTDADIEATDYGFLLPESVGVEVANGEKYLYVVAEETVFGYRPDDYYGGAAETSIDGEVFHVVEPEDASATWERRKVEVTN